MAKSFLYSHIFYLCNTGTGSDKTPVWTSYNENIVKINQNGEATVKGASKTVIWETSDPSVATVDEKGRVTSVSAGTATITAAANGISDSVTVTVADYDLTIN